MPPRNREVKDLQTLRPGFPRKGPGSLGQSRANVDDCLPVTSCLAGIDKARVELNAIKAETTDCGAEPEMQTTHEPSKLADTTKTGGENHLPDGKLYDDGASVCICLTTVYVRVSCRK